LSFQNKPLNEFLTETASRNPVPGGGSAAALAGSTAASLLVMAGNLTNTDRSRDIVKEAEKIQQRLEQLIDEDANSFNVFLKADKTEKESALKNAAMVPLETATLSYKVLELSREAIRVCKRSVITDAGTAGMLAESAVQSALFNVQVNLASITDADFVKMTEKRLENYTYLSEIKQEIIDFVQKQLG